MVAGHNRLARLLAINMEVLKTTAISEKKAAKLLKKFVESKESEENADLVVRAVAYFFAAMRQSPRGFESSNS